jgi:hypothetical protein
MTNGTEAGLSPMDKPLHVATYLPTLHCGGTERLNVILMDFLASRGYDVTAVVHEADGELRSALPRSGTVVDLNAGRTLVAIPKLARWLRTAKPDILFSSLGHNNIAAQCASAVSAQRPDARPATTTTDDRRIRCRVRVRTV